MNFNKTIRTLYSLKWNPFAGELPNEALIIAPEIEKFCWRVENLVLDGGYASISGECGQGKSTALRILSNRLGQLREVRIGSISRPQSNISDFYRELGHLFEINFKPSNRWGGYKSLREKWINHIETTLFRPIILIDEAQDMDIDSLNELRFLSSTNYDSKTITAVVLCGDSRLPEKFKEQKLIPLASRIRARLQTKPATKDEMVYFLEESISRAGNANLMSKELIELLSNHSNGNYRVLVHMARELLAMGAKKELSQLNIDLYCEIFGFNNKQQKSKK